MSSRNIKIFVRLFLFIVLDQGTKHMFYDAKIGSSFWWITPVFNTGISRSMPIPQTIIITISVIALLIFIYLYQKKKIPLRVAICLIAGTVGNLSDRIFLWGVRDFINIQIIPVFNIADMLLNAGIILLVIREFLSWKSKK